MSKPRKKKPKTTLEMLKTTPSLNHWLAGKRNSAGIMGKKTYQRHPKHRKEAKEE